MSKLYNPATAKQLIDEVCKSDLYSQFIVQIQKDLNRAGIDHTLKTNKPKELFSEIAHLLLEKIQNTFNEYLNLLYAVDVSEVKIRELDSENSIDIVEYATYLILKREWQKVWLRNNL